MSLQRVSVIVPDFLFLSDMTAALDENVVLGRHGYGFTHIINATNGCAPNKFADTAAIQYLNINIEDDAASGDEMLAAFDTASKWVLANGIHDMRLLVHCMCGVSRSASIVIALLAKLQIGVPQGASVWRCLKLVKEHRPVVQPNAGFLRALLSWQDSLSPESKLTADEQEQMLRMIADLKPTGLPRAAGDVQGALDRLAGADSSCALL